MASLAERYKRAKGVNRPASSSDREKGTSEAGSLLRAYLLKPDDIGKWGKAFAKDDQKATLKDLVGMRDQDRTNLAGGGEVEKGVNKPVSKSKYGSKGVSESGESYRDYKSNSDSPYARAGARYAMRDHKRVLKDLVGMRDQDRTNLAGGGEVESDTQQGHETNEQDDDIVSRIMNKFYSHGGKIADKTEISKEDQLDFPKDEDLVSRIMKKRAKKC